MMLQVPLNASNLELLAQQVVDGFIIGLHKSPFHGFSVEFAEHRQYNPGDPLRHVDWKVFGKSEKLFVKKYEEETNLRCTIVLDCSSSMQYPKEATQLSKLQYACLISAAILQLLKKQLDAAALTLFDEKIIYNSACRAVGNHYQNLMTQLSQVLDYNSSHKSSSISKVLHTVADQVHKRSLIIVLSDMMDNDPDPNPLLDALQHLKHNKHEVILIQLFDKHLEQDFNFESRPLEFVDLENAERIKLQPNMLKSAYTKAFEQYRKYWEEKCFQLNINRLELDLQDTPQKALHSFLLKRNKMY